MAREKLFYGVLCGALIATVSVKAASTYSYVTISKGQSSVKSEAVGVSTSAKYFALNKSTSSGALDVRAYACWVGWPYTLEYSASLQPGDSVTHYEPQDKNSSFYVKLVGNGLCDGSAYVEAK